MAMMTKEEVTDWCRKLITEIGEVPESMHAENAERLGVYIESQKAKLACLKADISTALCPGATSDVDIVKMIFADNSTITVLANWVFELVQCVESGLK